MGAHVQRRMFVILLLMSFGIAALLGRLFLIQVADTRSYQGHDLVTEAVSQRREMFLLDSGRGDILDRNGQSLTGGEVHGVLVMPLWQGNIDLAKVNRLAMILHLNTDSLKNALTAIKKPALLRVENLSGKLQTVQIDDTQAQAITDLQMAGIYPKHVKVRYGDDMLARHVIGFLGQDPQLVANSYTGKYPLDERIGKMGLEYTFQEELRGLGRSRAIGYYVDAYDQPINGLGIRVINGQNVALNVKTTLDTNIQRSVEKAMDDHGIKSGAAVILDTQTEEILAMASRPNFDVNQPIQASNFPVNKAVEATFPGSVFKSVVAAAALEKGVVKPTDTFQCNGSIKIGDGTLNCWTTHGKITAEEGFAESCNVVYATIAMKLGRDTIDQYAKKLGFEQIISEPVDGRTLIYGEAIGSVFRKEYTSLRLLANTGIGQEDVRVSPLQTAHLIAVIANGGMSGHPSLVKDLQTTDTGAVYRQFPDANKQRVLDVKAADELQKWMREVVTAPKGTAHRLDDAKMPIAGKTGTAQTGDPNAYNYWFAGFAPANQPRYAIVVMSDQSTDPQGGVAVQETIKQIVNSLP